MRRHDLTSEVQTQALSWQRDGAKSKTATKMPYFGILVAEREREKHLNSGIARTGGENEASLPMQKNCIRSNSCLKQKKNEKKEPSRPPSAVVTEQCRAAFQGVGDSERDRFIVH